LDAKQRCKTFGWPQVEVFLFLGRIKNGGSKEKISDWDAYAEWMKKVRDSYVWFLLFLLESRV
jgi:hypothetical protein